MDRYSNGVAEIRQSQIANTATLWLNELGWIVKGQAVMQVCGRARARVTGAEPFAFGNPVEAGTWKSNQWVQVP